MSASGEMNSIRARRVWIASRIGAGIHPGHSRRRFSVLRRPRDALCRAHLIDGDETVGNNDDGVPPAEGARVCVMRPCPARRRRETAVANRHVFSATADRCSRAYDLNRTKPVDPANQRSVSRFVLRPARADVLLRKAVPGKRAVDIDGTAPQQNSGPPAQNYRDFSAMESAGRAPSPVAGQQILRSASIRSHAAFRAMDSQACALRCSA